jgi:outer membrane receptor protein involved in Fe transport
VKEQVGIYLDESVISLSLFTPDIDLFDLNRVETLRGPQGTLFGSGSVGGTIRYITNQPRLGRTEGQVEANLNLVDGKDIGGHLKGAINLPLGANAALRVVGYHTEYGGFIDALREGGGIDRNVNDGHRTGGRVSVLIEPTDNISITPRVLYQKWKQTALTARKSTTFTPIRSTRRARGSPSASASSSCCSTRSSRTRRSSPTWSRPSAWAASTSPPSPPTSIVTSWSAAMPPR